MNIAGAAEKVKRVKKAIGGAFDKRPLFYCALAAMLGICLFAEKASVGLSAALLAAALLLLLFCRAKRLYVVIMALLVLSSYFRAVRIDSHEGVLDEYLPAKVHVTGKLVSAITTDSEKTSAVLEICAVSEIPEYSGRERVRFSVYDTEFSLLPGGVYQLYGKLSLPSGPRNPGGMDYRRYLQSRRLYYSMYASPEDVKLLRAEALPLHIEKLYALRRSWEQTLSENLSEPSAGLVRGMLFGSAEIDENALSAFRTLSLAHIFAVSGLHMGIIYSFCAFVLKKLRIKGLLSLLLTAAVLGVYCVLTGLSVSAVRAAVMLLCAMLPSCSGKLARRGDTLNNLCIAAVGFMLYNPYTIFSLSFQLSFGAVAGIALFAKPTERALLRAVKSAKLRENKTAQNAAALLGVSFGAQCGSALLSAASFHSFSPAALLANMLIIPFIMYVVLFALLALLFSPLPVVSRVFFGAVMLVMRLLTKAAEILSSFKYAELYVAGVKWQHFVIFYSLLLALFGCLNRKSKAARFILTALLALGLLAESRSYALPEADSVSFLDVGFGDSCVVRTKDGATVLIDGGGGFYGGDTASSVLLPYFFAENIREINAVIATHSDADHMGGILGVIGRIPIGIIYANDDGGALYPELAERAAAEGIRVVSVYEGDTIEIGANCFSVLNPDKAIPEKASLNDKSIIVAADISDVRFIFLGDGGKRAEENLLSDSDSYFLNFDFAKAAHHGSAFKTDEFLLRFAAKNYIVSVGGNGYSLPNEEWIELMNTADAAHCRRTDEYGMLRVNITEYGKYELISYLKGKIDESKP